MLRGWRRGWEIAPRAFLRVENDCGKRLRNTGARKPKLRLLLVRIPRQRLTNHTLSTAYDSGQTHLLLQSHGTLPITYRNATYHIPLCIWFPLEYPRKAPMVYVQPTREMAIRRSAEVDPSGRVVGGEVADWERKWEVSG